MMKRLPEESKGHIDCIDREAESWMKKSPKDRKTGGRYFELGNRDRYPVYVKGDSETFRGRGVMACPHRWPCNRIGMAPGSKARVEKSAGRFGAVARGVCDSVTAGLAVLTQRRNRFAG